MIDKSTIIINQSQCTSFIAYHLIRFWPDPMPPNLENILAGWIRITERDFDDFECQEILNKELASYFETTLGANSKFREMIKKEGFDYKRFIKAVCDGIREEIKELKE